MGFSAAYLSKVFDYWYDDENDEQHMKLSALTLVFVIVYVCQNKCKRLALCIRSGHVGMMDIIRSFYL